MNEYYEVTYQWFDEVATKNSDVTKTKRFREKVLVSAKDISEAEKKTKDECGTAEYSEFTVIRVTASKIINVIK